MGVDSAWEQKKLEARKMLENALTPQRPVRAVFGGFTAAIFLHAFSIPQIGVESHRYL